MSCKKRFEISSVLIGLEELKLELLDSLLVIIGLMGPGNRRGASGVFTVNDSMLLGKSSVVISISGSTSGSTVFVVFSTGTNVNNVVKGFLVLVNRNLVVEGVVDGVMLFSSLVILSLGVVRAGMKGGREPGLPGLCLKGDGLPVPSGRNGRLGGKIGGRRVPGTKGGLLVLGSTVVVVEVVVTASSSGRGHSLSSERSRQFTRPSQ